MRKVSCQTNCFQDEEHLYIPALSSFLPIWQNVIHVGNQWNPHSKKVREESSRLEAIAIGLEAIANGL